MRILVESLHSYPARAYPVAHGGLASARITDVIVKGLAELGHDVFYRVNLDGMPLPKGVQWVDNEPTMFDVAHRQVGLNLRMADYRGPWVRTCHTDLQARGIDRGIAESNWIFCSRTLAATYKSSRSVVNGIDPAEFCYSETKRDYFLFVACLDRALEKGLDVAISLARRIGFKLLVAGSAAKEGVINQIQQMCVGADVELLGDVQGARRAQVFGEARALIFPTQLNEAFGTVMSECMMSGTPVIASHHGVCPEIVSPDTGFVCASDAEYFAAFEKVRTIRPAACRERAMREYHYLRMARDYVTQYEQEIGLLS
jgi:glycosyltransferase involved in cell wall biosynthesis